MHTNTYYNWYWSNVVGAIGFFNGNPNAYDTVFTQVFEPEQSSFENSYFVTNTNASKVRYINEYSKFSEELFNEGSADKIYNYCPSSMMEGNNIMHVWYCTNLINGNVTDYIAYRKGTLGADGKWSFSAKQVVLSPTSGTWDSRHVCDPTVIKGIFNYNYQQYSYMMAYLGCKTSDNTDNQVGLAVAKTPDGPWIKIANPIAQYLGSTDYSSNPKFWGYGQPSLINIDKMGRVMLFYTCGVSQLYTRMEIWNFSNLNYPVKESTSRISDANIKNMRGQSDIINNADFAYDPVRKRIYVVHEMSPYFFNHDGSSANNGSLVTSANHVAYVEMHAEDTYAGQTLAVSSSYSWASVGFIEQSKTGFWCNHNAGFLTDEYGHLTNTYTIPVIYTVSGERGSVESQAFWKQLGSYRLHGYLFDIK